MDTKKKIVVIGSSNTDMVIKSDRLPKPGETILGGNFLMNHGGKGANQAVAAARLGGDVTFICKIGNDIFGNETLEMFHKEKIDTTYVGITPQEPSGVALINVDKKGENCIVVASGANGTLSIDDIMYIDAVVNEVAVFENLERLGQRDQASFMNVGFCIVGGQTRSVSLHDLRSR